VKLQNVCVTSFTQLQLVLGQLQLVANGLVETNSNLRCNRLQLVEGGCSPGPGCAQNGQKTGLNRTFKLYPRVLFPLVDISNR